MKLTDFFAQFGGRKSERDPQPARRASAGPRADPHPYHAVSVVPGMLSCAAARKARGKRFLSRAAPSIPLPGCTMSQECACHFQKHVDRRHGDRRLFGPDPDARFYSGQERRRAAGRRATDPRPPIS